MPRATIGVMRALAVFLLIGLAVSACGDDDATPSRTAAATTAATSTTAAVVTEPPASSSTAPQTTGSPTTTAAPTSTTAAGGGDFATFDPPPEGLNWIQASKRGGATMDEQPELCIIAGSGETVRIIAQNFLLEKLGDDAEWRLSWRSFEGQFDGTVAGEVDGMTVTFEGESDGVEVRGSVTCLEA